MMEQILVVALCFNGENALSYTIAFYTSIVECFSIVGLWYGRLVRRSAASYRLRVRTYVHTYIHSLHTVHTSKVPGTYIRIPYRR